jgi:hypothetical protein
VSRAQLTRCIDRRRTQTRSPEHNNPPPYSYLLLQLQLFAIRVGEIAHHDNNEVDQRPNPTPPARQQLSDPRSDLPDVKAVNPETTDKKAEQQRHQSAFIAHHRINRLLLNLLRSTRKRAPAFNTHNGIIVQLGTAMTTVFHGLKSI